MTRTGSLMAAAALAVALTACSSASSTTSAAGGSSSSAATSGAAMVETAEIGDLGPVLVNADGFTLYLFESDTGSTSTCTGSCAGTWPALTTDGAPAAGDGVDDGKLGTTARDDGSTQVTYDGHPLYTYAGDSAAGDANGQGIGDVWFAVTADGTAAAAGGTGDTGGAYGHG